MRFLWVWFLHIISRLFGLRRPAVGVGPHLQLTLNDDLLMEILRRPEINFKDMLRISLTCHRFRRLTTPLIFGRHTWSPWRWACRSFPPETLWPHIRVLIVEGPSDWGLLDLDRRRFMAAQLQIAIPTMTAVHTLIFTAIGGGLWLQLLDAINAAPALAHLVMDHSPWLGESRDVFDLPPTSGLPPLRRLAYIAPHALKNSDRVITRTKRPFPMLESECQNLRSMLRACAVSLESLTLPGELILLAVDPSLPWDSLRELYVEGYWPDKAVASLHSVLLTLHNLRIASLRFHPAGSGPISPVVSIEVLSVSVTDTFLPHLRQFEVASLARGDLILSALPQGLEKLSVIQYPPLRPLSRYPGHILRSSALLDMLAGVYLPAVIDLELWYRTDLSDETFLRCLPRVFPSLQRLEMHRFIGEDLDDMWNPAPILQHVLAELKDLRVFSLEPDIPERRHRLPPHCMNHKQARYIRRLRAVAEDIILETPWLAQIQMYVQVDDEAYWEEWDVISGPGDRASLRSPHGPEKYHPEIYAILEGPVVEAAESDSDSEWL
ncbi:hypothetical protein B0H14DRAFT_2875678 [Mycena olivaceomarginata]|nr:hypothetical protein B0H14DRAFT_2875678 [Mycena olivaceomarginata]